MPAHHHTPKAKGQWEMSVQADPQMAKRALSEALLSEKNSSSDAASNYAASAKNIARLLEGWMKSNNSSSSSNNNNATLKSTSPNSKSLRQMSATSVSNYLASLESLDSFGLEDQATSVPEGSPGTAQTAPLELLKSWLLDTNVGDEEHSESFLSIVMDQTN